MRIKGVFVFFCIFVFLCGAYVSHAQDSATPAATPTPTEAPFNFEKAYKDYVFNMDVYNKAHSDYLLSKAQYLQAKTLASQTKAQESTARMLIARDDAVITYLLSIRQKATESQGIDGTTLNGLTSRIDVEVNWYRNHKAKIDSAASLNDLTKDSDDAFKHYPTTESLVYETLANIPLGKELVLRGSLNEIVGNTKNIISRIRSKGDHDVTTAERWILETNNKLSRSLDKEVEAQKLFPTIQDLDKLDQKTAKVNAYNNVITRLEESIQYLKEASGYMKEVIKSIKRKA